MKQSLHSSMVAQGMANLQVSLPMIGREVGLKTVQLALPPRCGPTSRHLVVAASAGSSAAALPSPSDPAMLSQQLSSTTTRHHHAQRRQQHAQLPRSIRNCSSYTALLAVVQQHGTDLSSSHVTSVLQRAAMIAKAASLQHRLVATTNSLSAKPAVTSKASMSLQQSRDSAAAQQVVSSCLALLLHNNEQMTAYELSSCLLSLAALCSKDGPAAGIMSSSASPAVNSRSRSEQEQQLLLLHQQQAAGGGSIMVQQLLQPVSNRALEQLLVVAAPQHQLQQLLELVHSKLLPAAQPQQLVDMLYGLAALRLRPAPHVLRQVLLHTQLHMEAMSAQLPARSSSNVYRSSRQQYSPRSVAQLLWAAATLQLQLPHSWLTAYFSASSMLLQQFSAQDVANTAWAAATLRLHQLHRSSSSSEQYTTWLSCLQEQAIATAGCMSGQGLANTLWGLAVMHPQAVRGQLLSHLLQCCISVAPRLDGQNLANVIWAVARCLGSHGSSSSSIKDGGVASVPQQLQQLLSCCSPLLPRLQPRDWANIVWACGQLQLQPGAEVLAHLWRKTPAGFSTSLNPHSSRPMAWQPQVLGNMIWGCARLRVRPTAVWLQGFEAATIMQLPQFGNQLLANTLWAYGELQYIPSDAWLQQYWQQAGAIVQQLQTAVQAAAAVQGTPSGGALNSSSGSKLLQQPGEALRQVEAAARQVVMVLQAAGRLQQQPPQLWTQTAVAALAAAAALQRPAQLQQQHAALHLKTLTAALYATSSLQHIQPAATSSSGSSEQDMQQQVQQQLLHQAGVGSNNTGRGCIPVHLSAMDVLLLLLALPGLAVAADGGAATVAAAQLLARSQQLLMEDKFSGSQLVQLAVAAAKVTRGCASSSSSAAASVHNVSSHDTSSSISRAPGCRNVHQQGVDQQLWQVVGSINQSQQSGKHSHTEFVTALAKQLRLNCRSLTALELTHSLMALVQLHKQPKPSSRPTRSSTLVSRSLSAYVDTAAHALGQQMASLPPRALAAAGVSLAELKYCPGAAWMHAFLLHSSCQWEQYSNHDVCKLLHSLPRLLQYQQHASLLQQQSSLGSTSAAGPKAARTATVAQLGLSHAGQPQQHRLLLQQHQSVCQWLQCWLSETVHRLQEFSPQQLVTTAAGLRKLTLLQQQQKQYAKMLLPAAWSQEFLQATAKQLPHMTAAEMVSLAAAAAQLQLIGRAGGHAWCAAVAQEVAGRAAAAREGLTETARISSSSSSSSRGTRSVLQVHHVGLLAVSLRRLAYQMPWKHKQVLLQYVLEACSCVDSHGSINTVKPSKMLQLLVLLPKAGWMPDKQWVAHMQASKAGQLLQLQLQKTPGAWEQLWSGLTMWEEMHTSA